MTTFYDLSDKDIKGNTVSMSTFQGKVLVLVNVASECGRTHSNYTQLPKLLQEYPSLEILAFPCNQFGGQEPVESFIRIDNYRVLSYILFMSFHDCPLTLHSSLGNSRDDL